MWTRRIILVAVLLTLVLGYYRFRAWQQSSRDQQRTVYLQQVYDGDPRKRLEAAEWLLNEDAALDPIRLIRAKAMMELDRHFEAREQLQMMIDKETPDREKFVSLQIISYFTEAQNLVTRTDRQGAAGVTDRVKALMKGVETQALHLANSGRPLDLMLIEARRYDALVSANQFAAIAKRDELGKAQLAGVQQTIDTLGLELDELKLAIRGYDQKLSETCTKLIHLVPAHPEATELLFQYHMRHREFDQARGLALTAASWSEVPADMVGRMADALLDIEATYGEALTAADIDAAGRLVTHPRQLGKPSIQHAIARATYALALSAPDEAYEIAFEVLTKEWLNARALCIVARAHIDRNDGPAAVAVLQKYTELKRDPRVRYTLGLAYLAAGEARQTNLGNEALRQCLDLEPEHLPARLRLIESLAAGGFILEARNDIEVVEKLNPRHPRVHSLKAHLAVEGQDLGTIAELIDTQLKNNTTLLRAETVGLVAAMVLDDTARVRALSAALAATNKADVFVLLTERWLKLDAVRRARVAPVIVRSLHAYLDRDPLQSPERPRLPRTGALILDKTSGTAMPAFDKYEPLTTMHFVPRPMDLALESVEMALDQWPLTPMLLSSAAELNIWLGRATAARQWLRRLPPHASPRAGSIEALMDDYVEARFDAIRQSITDANSKPAGLSPTHRWMDLDLALRGQEPKQISDALTRLLTAHPWAELPLLMTVADALRHDQLDRAYAMLGVAEQVNPQLASLSRARLNLGLARASDALLDIEKTVADENGHTDVRRWAMEVRARAHLLMDQQPLAMSAFDQLAASLQEHQTDASLALADVLIEYGKPAGASEVLAGILSAPVELPRRTLDRVLVRAEVVMKPARLRSFVERMLSAKANDGVLQLYQARSIVQDDDVVAERIIRGVLARSPKSPRALMELAELLRAVQPNESRKIYRELTERGGRVAQAAQRVLDSMNAKQTDPPVSASVEGREE